MKNLIKSLLLLCSHLTLRNVDKGPEDDWFFKAFLAELEKGLTEPSIVFFALSKMSEEQKRQVFVIYANQIRKWVKNTQQQGAVALLLKENELLAEKVLRTIYPTKTGEVFSPNGASELYGFHDPLIDYHPDMVLRLIKEGVLPEILKERLQHNKVVAYYKK